MAFLFFGQFFLPFYCLLVTPGRIKDELNTEIWPEIVCLDEEKESGLGRPKLATCRLDLVLYRWDHCNFPSCPERG